MVHVGVSLVVCSPQSPAVLNHTTHRNISAVSRESFEQAYGEIWMLLNKTKVLDDKADTMGLVKAKLSDNAFGQ